MFFSIIVPVYNVAEYLEQCLSSILKQNFEDFELIIVNDGSSDGSQKICEKFSVSSKVHIVNQPNKGVSYARNQALNISSGRYILFVDGDDYIAKPNTLNELYKILKTENYPDFLYNSAVSTVMPRKTIKVKEFFHKHNNFKKYSGELALYEWLDSTEEYPWSIWGNVYKASIIKDNKVKFKEEVTLGEDADWLFRFLLKSKYNSSIKFPFYYYRVNRIGSAMTNQSFKNLNSYLNIVESWIHFSNKKNKKLENKIQDVFVKNYSNYFKYIYGLEENEIESLINRIKDLDLLNLSNDEDIEDLRKKIERYGYHRVFQSLYKKNKIKQMLKYVLTKFNLIDR